MKLKASEFLAMQIDHLEDISKSLRTYYKDNWFEFALELVKEIESIEKNLNDLCMIMIKKEQEKQKGSEL